MIAILNPIQASYVLEYYQNSNYNDRDYLYVGIGSTEERENQAFLQYDLSAYSNVLINSATLRLYSYNNESWSATVTLDAKRLTSAFSAGSVTWNSRPSSTDTNKATLVQGGYDVWYEWNVKDIVQAWVNGTSNYGFCVRQANSTLERTKCFKKSGTYAPQLVIDYTLPRTAPTAPTGVGLSPTTFESALRISWTKGSNGTNNPITGHEVRYQTSDNGSTWSSETVVDVSAAATYYDIPQAILNAYARGKYVRGRVGSESEYASTVFSGYSAAVRKNRAPNQPTSPSVPKTSYIPGETIRVSFANTGDPDNNLAGFEVATDQNETVVGTRASASATYVDVGTTGWAQGIQRRFRVHGYDALGVRGAWSIYTALVTLNTMPLAPEISYPAAGSTVYNRRPHILLKAAAINDGPKHILCVNDGSEKTTVQGTGFSCGINDNLSGSQQSVYMPPAELTAGSNNITARMYDSFLYSSSVNRSFTAATFAPTDPDLTVPGTNIKAVYITQLQTAIGNLITAYGLAPVAWTPCVAGTTMISIANSLISQLQTALQAVINRINGWDAANATFDISVEWISPAAAGGGVDRVKLRQAIEQLRSIITQI